MKKFTFLILFLLVSLTGSSQILTEGFENTTGPDADPSTNWTLGSGNWAVFDNGSFVSTVRWGITSTVATPPIVYQGVNAAQVNRENSGAGTISEEYLATPEIDLTAVDPAAVVQLKFYTRTFTLGNQGTRYEIRIAPSFLQDQPFAYTTIQTWTEDQLTADYNAYEEKIVDLSSQIGNSICVAFVKVNEQETGSIDGDRWLIDDVRVVLECPVPSGANASNVSLSSATLNWVTPAPNATSEVFIVNNGQIPVGQFPVGNGTSVNGTLAGTNYNYSFIANQTTAGVPFTANTTYQYYIRTVCSGSNQSVWIGPFDFTTQSPGLSCSAPISITTLPYSTTDNTANYADNTDTPQPAACAGTATNFMTGNDVFYSYTPATSGAISITMTPNANASGIFVYQGCANVGVDCLAGVANTGNGVRSIPSLAVTAGQTYIIVLSSNAAPQTYGYSLVIQQLNCAQPDNLNAPLIGQTTANLSWGNPGGATSWEVVVQPAGGPVPPGAGITTTNNTAYPVPGPLTQNTPYQYWVRADCGNGTFSAWAGPYVFRTLCDAFPVPFQEGFNSNSTTQACWTVLNVNADTDQWNMDSTLAPFEGNQSAELNTDINAGNNNDWLISPQIILTGNQRLKFHYRVQSDFEPNDFRVVLSTTGTAPASFTTTLLPLATYANENYIQAIVNLSAFTGPVNIAWHVPNGGLDGWRIFIDNVVIEDLPTCPEPTALSASAVLTTSATITWTNGNTETAWEYVVLPCGSPAPTAATPATGAISPGAGNLTGLAATTCYDVYIRAVCSATDSSPWSNPLTLTTQVAPPVCGGVFTDPGGPSADYANSTNSTVTICPTTPGDQVTVTFTVFDTEATWDGLYVFNGNSTAAPQIASANGPGNVPGGLAGSFWGNLTGANLPGPFSSEVDGCLTFNFRTDASVIRSGWIANVTCAPPPTCTKPTNVTNSNPTSSGATVAWTQLPNPDASVATEWNVLALPCGSPAPTATTTGFVTVLNVTNYIFNTLNPTTCYDVYVRAVCSSTDVSLWSTVSTFTTQIVPPACGGVFTDPEGPTLNYLNSTDSTVTICPTTVGEQVTVTFTEFNTEATWDGLYVFDGQNVTAPLFATANGAGNVPGGLAGSYWGDLTANLPGPFTATNPAGCLTFRFRSDGSVNRPGWVANVTCAPFPSCPVPFNVTVSNPTQTGATIAWTEVGTATEWEVFIVPAGSPAPTATSTGITTSSNPFTINTLNSGTSYNVYVRAICDPNDSSAWTFVRSFTTIIANDECAGAPIAPVNPNTTCAQVIGGTLIGATASTDPNTCGGNDDDDVWFQFTATSTAHTVSLLNITGSTQDLFHVVYSGACGTLTQLYCSDNNVSLANSLIVGQTYFVRVYSFTATPNQTSTFNLCIGTPVPPPSCITNTPAGDQCSTATPICNLNGYCGNTSASYDDSSWPELDAAFCGSIENNSFLSFVATSTTISFDVWVSNAQNNDGIQIMVFSAANCGFGPVEELTCWSPGNVAVGSTNISATGLIPGNTYYIMIDGFAGDVADYVIGANSGISTPIVINTNTSTTTSTICLGQTATLTATGGNGQYTWTPSTNLDTTTGSSVVFTPTAIGVYEITATSTDNNPICPQSGSSTQTITVVDIVDSIFDQIAPFCQTATVPVLPTTSTNGITGTWSPSEVSNTPGTTVYTFTPSVTQCANPATMSIEVTPAITPTFIAPAPICNGATAPELPLTSLNGIEGTWDPSIVSNTQSGIYTFTPDSSECALPTTLNIEVLANCSFGSFANAVWLTDCDTNNFFNTQGSGTSIIGPIENVFPNQDLGTYLSNSNTFKLRGAEVKTFKTPSSNVCSVKLNYRIYPIATTPPAFTVMDIPFFDDCNAGTFPSGGPCNNGDQKWQKVLTDAQNPIDLTAFPAGDYNLEVYYELVGDVDSNSQCDDTLLVNNNGANYIATYTLQNNPTFTYSDPITCNGTEGTIVINDLAPDTTYELSYTVNNSTNVTATITSNPNGSHTISGLNANVYSDFVLTVNGCVINSTETFTLVNPVITPTFAQVDAICQGGILNPLPTTATNGIEGTWSPALNNNDTTEYTFTPNLNQCAVNAELTITVNPNIVPTFTQVAAICAGDNLSPLPTTSNNGITGSWSPVLNNNDTTEYTFIFDSGQCAVNTTMTIVVNPIITPTFTQVSPICQGGTLNALPTTSTNNITGSWSPALNNNDTTEYTFTPDGSQCAINTTMTIVVTLPSITPTFTQVSPICQGGTLNALPTTSNNNITGSWSPALNNNDTTEYTFTPDGSQCAINTTMTIVVNPNTTPTFDSVAAICQGETLNPLPTTSLNGIDGTWSPALNNNGTTVYTFTPTSGLCPLSTTLEIQVNQRVVPTFDALASVCIGATSPSLPSSSLNGIAGTWNPATISTTTSGTSSATFTPNTGECATTASISLTVSPSFSFALEGDCLNNAYTISVADASGFDLNTATYQWLIGTTPIDDTNSASFNVSEYLNDTPNNEVLPLTFSVIVTSNGCSVTQSFVVDSITCLIQRGISVNNDGKNDTFDLSSYDVKKLTIFNRYGTIAYEKTDYVNEWKGQTNSGDELPDGTYFYTIEFNNGGETITGWIYVSRVQ
jgi:gliding motility-associated-like protein